MASIQKIIVERVQLYIRSEIKKHLRLQNDEGRKMKGDLAECKRRLSELEKNVEEKREEIVGHWFDRMRTSGESLTALRRRLEVSQTELALLLDSNPATVNRWESGKVKLSRKSCEKIIKFRSLSKSEVQRLLEKKIRSRP